MKFTSTIYLSLLFSYFFVTNSDGQHIELGEVTWHRDLDAATIKSQDEGKPIFILFQEVPGCLTCRNYGQQVLSHPLVVEAIETYFIPVAIFNNKKGKDAEALTFFQEPSWNNPVVRIVDSYKRDIIPRVNGNYSLSGIVGAITDVMTINNIEVPTYLEILEEELSAESYKKQAYLSMYCFWTGEKVIGQIDGVVHTEPGFMDGKEVVKVEYDSRIANISGIAEAAQSRKCAETVYTTEKAQVTELDKKSNNYATKLAKSYRPDRDLKYYLSRTSYRFIPMTALQAVRVNSAIGQGASPNKFLSPRQLACLSSDDSKSRKNVIGVPLIDAWKTNGCAIKS